MAERSIAEKFFDAGDILATRGRSNPILEREKLEMERAARESDKKSAASKADANRLKVIDGLLKTARENMGEEEFKILQSQLEPARIETLNRLGVPVTDLPEETQPEPEPKTEIGRLFKLQDNLARQAQEAETPQERARIESRLASVQSSVDKLSTRAPNLQIATVGGRSVVYDKNKGQIVDDLGPAGTGPGAPESTSFVRVMKMDENGNEVRVGPDMRADDPEIDKLLKQPGTYVQRLGTGGGQEIEVTGPGGTNVRVTAGGRGGVPRSIGEANPLAKQVNAIEGILTQIAALDQSVRPGDVGLRAEVQDQLINRGAGVFAELFGMDASSLVDSDFVENRALMDFISERAQRVMSDFPDRFSNQDVDRVNRYLPRNNKRVTFKEFKSRLRSLAAFLNDKRLMAQHQLGRKAVLDMSFDEILDAVDKGTLSSGLAEDLLATRFPDETKSALGMSEEPEQEEAEPPPPRTNVPEPFPRGSAR